mmetsp:Transcript_62502/g.174617  ORF Transcript_62502/g.174617 Transcript_62502/m.174617 type:complete len:226 (-) Transcript_62502:90-767(-)
MVQRLWQPRLPYRPLHLQRRHQSMCAGERRRSQFLRDAQLHLLQGNPGFKDGDRGYGLESADGRVGPQQVERGQRLHGLPVDALQGRLLGPRAKAHGRLLQPLLRENGEIPMAEHGRLLALPHGLLHGGTGIHGGAPQPGEEHHILRRPPAQHGPDEHRQHRAEHELARGRRRGLELRQQFAGLRRRPGHVGLLGEDLPGARGRAELLQVLGGPMATRRSDWPRF